MNVRRRSGAARGALFLAVCAAGAVGAWMLLRQPPAPLASARGAAKPAGAEASEPASQFDESWQVIYIGEARVGFGRRAIERQRIDGRDTVVADAEMSMVLTRFGQEIRLKSATRTEETVAGDLLRFEFEMLNPPAAPTRSVGRVDGKRLVIESEVGGKKARNELPWDGSLKSSTWPERELAVNPLKPGEKRTFRTFSAEFSKPDVVTVTAEGEETVRLLNGEEKPLLKITAASTMLPGVVIHEYRDADGKTQLTRTSLLGLGMTIHAVSKEEALKSLSGEEADLAVATLVKVDRIDRPQQTRRVVYRLTTPGDDPQPMLAVGPTQAVERVGPHTVDLTVTSIEPPAKPPVDAESPAQEYVAPNEYLQSDDSLIRKYAAEAADGQSDPWTVSRRLERWVYDKLARKNFSTLLASAAEVAKELQGDCTEHAVLLAAMARAQGIPSRVAIGLVYVGRESSFGGHMWTEVFVNGLWVPLDATLGQGGIAADHIKFTDSSFAAKDAATPFSAFLPLVSVLGKLHIEVRDVRHR